VGRAPLFPVFESRAVLRDERLHLREQLGGAPVHEHQARVVALGHVSEDLEHLVLRRRRLAVLVGAALRLLEVAEPLERRRDRDELLDLAIELGAKVLERRPQLEAPRLELEIARDLREVGVQPLEP
jgi:hypothetical protein